MRGTGRKNSISV